MIEKIKKKYIGTGAFYRRYLYLALPMIVQNAITNLVSFLDNIMVGQLGTEQMSGVAIVNQLIFVYNLAIFGAASAASIFGAQYFGKGDHKGHMYSFRFKLYATLLVTGLTILLFATKGADLISLYLTDTAGSGATEVALQYGLEYLGIMMVGLVPFAVNQSYATNIKETGQTLVPMIASFVAVGSNAVLDYLFIFGIGPFPVLRVTGAAIATVTAQMIVTVMFFIFAMKDTVLFQYVRYLKKPDLHHLKGIVRIGFPTSVQSMLFTGISMIIARLVAGYGDAAVAVQKVGSQIESISWMTADGFAAAVNSFTSQNHGAGKKRRIYQGYVSALKVVFVWGIFCTLLLICCPAPVFRIFITEKDVIPLGVDYLRILGVSQLFMSLEITTAGAFSGYGKTVPPSVISIVFTALRIPLALILVHTTLALNGIWWSITISSILKGVLLFVWFYIFMRGEKLIYNRK